MPDILQEKVQYLRHQLSCSSEDDDLAKPGEEENAGKFTEPYVETEDIEGNGEREGTSLGTGARDSVEDDMETGSPARSTHGSSSPEYNIESSDDEKEDADTEPKPDTGN